MGAERVVRWGPPALSQVVTDQLGRHGLGSADAVACARELAAAVGPAARASSFVDLGSCRFLEGDISGALAAWQQAIISGQTAPAARALFNLGLLHEHLGLYDDAVQRFEAAESHGVAPYSGLATLARARAQHRGGEHDRAVATLARHADRLMEADPENPILAETLLALGDVAEDAGQLERSEQAYRAAMNSGDDTVRELASLSLIQVLRFIGHEEEAQQIVEDTGLAVADPVVALDRVELLIRLGRFDEAEGVLDDLDAEKLAVAEQFRLTTTQIDLGRVNDAIDILESLAGKGAAETRARAAYRLGEVYLDHDMSEPAATMFATVRGLQPGYWADKASLVLGDLAMADGRHRIAAAHWADAAASRVDTVSSSARDRLVDAVVAPPVPEPAAAPPAIDAPGPVNDAGPATEAVDMVTVLDDTSGEAGHDDAAPATGPAVRSEVSGSLDAIAPHAGALDTPGEITPVAGVLMSIPVADAVDVVVPGEPIASELPDLASPEAVAPPEPVTPTVIPLRRRSTASAPPGASPAEGAPNQDAPNEEARDDGAPLDVPHSPTSTASSRNGQSSAASEERISEDRASAEVSVPHGTPSGISAAPDDEPVVIKLGRNSDNADTVIDLRDDDAVANPYAALAPEALDDDPAPSTRNPYAELAPNFGSDPLSGSTDDESGPSTFSNFA